VQSDYAKLYAFAIECTRVMTFPSPDAAAMGVKNALFQLHLENLSKPEPELPTEPVKAEAIKQPDPAPAATKSTSK
jgi:hypothetical protein